MKQYNKQETERVHFYNPGARTGQSSIKDVCKKNTVKMDSLPFVRCIPLSLLQTSANMTKYALNIQ